MEKVIRDGKVAILFSPGFGAGWYSWNQEHPEIVFDPMIVDCVEKKDMAKLETYIAMKYPEIYTGGLDDLTVKWISEGTLFRIHEYDGSESIEVKEDLDWLIA
jgi:hypothetical protein